MLHYLVTCLVLCQTVINRYCTVQMTVLRTTHKDFITPWIVHCTQTKQTLLYIITQQKIVNEQEKAHNVLSGMLKQTDNIVIPH
jgi:hypothetical protein